MTGALILGCAEFEAVIPVEIEGEKKKRTKMGPGWLAPAARRLVSRLRRPDRFPFPTLPEPGRFPGVAHSRPPLFLSPTAKKKNKKGKTLTLTDFLAEDGGGGGGPTYIPKPVSWADETDDLEGDGTVTARLAGARGSPGTETADCRESLGPRR